MSEKQPLIQGNTPGYPQGAPTSYPGTSGYPGGAQQGVYGGTQQAPGPYGAAQGGYPGGVPPQQGGYPPSQQGGYQGGQPPQQGGYPGGPPPQQGGYPGGPPPQQGGYPGGPPPQQGGYPGGPVGTQGGAPQSGAPQYKGDMPADDVEDNPNAVAPTPSAPSIDKMDEISGYSNVGFSGAALPPPSYDEAMKGPPPERQHISNVPTITEQEAREALLAFVAENCCYGKGAAEDLKFNDLQSSSAFHYTLETFGEGRQTSWAYEPFTGQPIDSPMNGPAPGPWDIQANPPTLFKNFKSEIEVPHTASVKPCHNCFASGYVRCHRCHGRGRVRCSSCGGSGHTTVFRDGEHQRERCVFCHGNGRRRCDTCRGCGMVECSVCKSYRQLKCYIKLTILWTNHVADHIVERTPLPDHLIRGVTGQLAFDETQPRVWPLQHFHEAEINSASSRLIREQQFPNERILQQRHQVRIVPVTQCMFRWKDNDSDFFVYGFEHKVHAPKYPQQCCCGCSIL